MSLDAPVPPFQAVIGRVAFAFSPYSPDQRPSLVGLTLYDLSDPLRPAEAGQVTVPGNIGSISGSNERAFVMGASGGRDALTEGYGLHVFDISDPRDPVPAGFVPRGSPGGNGKLVASGNVAYVADGMTLLVLDMQNPHTPNLLGMCPISHAAGFIATAADLVYTSDLSGLSVIDVNDPSSPREIANYQTLWRETIPGA